MPKRSNSASQPDLDDMLAKFTGGAVSPIGSPVLSPVPSKKQCAAEDDAPSSADKPPVFFFGSRAKARVSYRHVLRGVTLQESSIPPLELDGDGSSTPLLQSVSSQGITRLHSPALICVRCRGGAYSDTIGLPVRGATRCRVPRVCDQVCGVLPWPVVESSGVDGCGGW